MRTHLIIDLGGGDEDKYSDRFMAARDFIETHPNVDVTLVLGKNKLPQPSRNADKSSIVHADEPTKRSLELLKEQGGGNVLVTAGDTCSAVNNTGDFRIHPDAGMSLISEFPKVKGRIVFGDVGAIKKAHWNLIVWSALYGSIVAETLHGLSLAKVGVLNIGEEDHKGGATYGKALEMLQHILGNDVVFIEYDTALDKGSKIDVLATHGELGNQALKISEGMIRLMKGKVAHKCETNPLLWSIAPSAKIVDRVFWNELNWRDFSGAYLMGSRYPIIITHGKSDRLAMYNAICRAADPFTQIIWDKVHIDKRIEKFISILRDLRDSKSATSSPR